MKIATLSVTCKDGARICWVGGLDNNTRSRVLYLISWILVEIRKFNTFSVLKERSLSLEGQKKQGFEIQPFIEP